MSRHCEFCTLLPLPLVVRDKAIQLCQECCEVLVYEEGSCDVDYRWADTGAHGAGIMLTSNGDGVPEHAVCVMQFLLRALGMDFTCTLSWADRSDALVPGYATGGSCVFTVDEEYWMCASKWANTMRANLDAGRRSPLVATCTNVEATDE